MSSPPDTRRPPSCPVCGKPASADSLPFCSQGCRDRDLLRWLDEGYAIPGRPSPEADD